MWSFYILAQGTTTEVQSLADPGEATVTLEGILQFFTGAIQAPCIGFHDPELNFNVYPTASTCALQLTLPTKYSVYEDFKKSLTTGFLCHGGFGLD